MKKFYAVLCLTIALLTQLQAQAPQGFNYQATVRNSAGDLIVNTNVQFKFNIIQDLQTNAPQYSETHEALTDDLGHVDLIVGQGSATEGVFSELDWSLGSYYLEIELDTGNGYVAMGTTQLLSVPYALYAENSGNTTAQPTANLWYESWSMTTHKNIILNSSGNPANYPINTNTIHYHGFIQPESGTYGSMSIRFRRVTPGSTEPPSNFANIHFGIYSSNGNLADPEPDVLLGSGTLGTLQFQPEDSSWNPNPAIVTADEIFTLSFNNPISVTRGNIYYVAFRINYANPSNMDVTVYESDDTDSSTNSKWVYVDLNPPSSSLPENAATPTLEVSNSPAYWFLLK